MRAAGISRLLNALQQMSLSLSQPYLNDVVASSLSAQLPLRMPRGEAPLRFGGIHIPEDFFPLIVSCAFRVGQ